MSEPDMARVTTKITLFHPERVFDGEQVRAGMSVLVADGVVAQVGKRIARPQHAAVIDAPGQTLLPGLIDAHTHVFAGSLVQAVAFGVTTELDMFADPKLIAEVKSAVASHSAMADVRSAGTGATAPGGHPSGLVERGFYPPFATITNPSEADRFVSDRVVEGSDYIKIIVDDGCALGYPRPTLGSETVAALIAAAHRQGKLAIVHAMDVAAAELAADAGADGLAHLPLDASPGGEFVSRLADRGVFVTPTLSVLEAICQQGHGPAMVSDQRFAPWLSDTSKMMLTMVGGNFPLGPDPHVNLERVFTLIAELHQSGVPILAGTDAGTLGVAHGASLHHELELLVAAGLAPLDALRAATCRPATIFGLADRGRLRSGLLADLLLVEGDPTTNITATANITGIWRHGERVDRAAPHDLESGRP